MWCMFMIRGRVGGRVVEGCVFTAVSTYDGCGRLVLVSLTNPKKRMSLVNEEGTCSLNQICFFACR